MFRFFFFFDSQVMVGLLFGGDQMGLFKNEGYSNLLRVSWNVWSTHISESRFGRCDCWENQKVT